MPRKKKLTEPEIHAMILTDVKIRLGCKDFEPEFTLHRTDVDSTRYPSANWDVEGVQSVEAWKPDCAQAFQEAVARSEEHTSELQSPCNLVCRLLLEKKKKIT